MMMLFLFQLSCASPHLAWSEASPALLWSVELVDFGAVSFDQPGAQDLELLNQGPAAAWVLLSDSGSPFALDRAQDQVPADGSLRFTLRCAPQSTDITEGWVRAEPLYGSAFAPLELALRCAGDPDADQDGASHPKAGGLDCDDQDSARNPAATEIWYDGVDADCDGGSDYDADQDGYEASPWGRDCDDEAPEVYPGAEERWYDGQDGSCDGGSDYDADADGHDMQPWGADCDDEDPQRSPDSAERVNGVDDDCDGAVDEA